MSRRKYEDEYDEEEYEEEEVEEEDPTDRMMHICETQLEDLLKNDPYNQEKIGVWLGRLEHLKKCRALDAQARESDATKAQAETVVREAKSEKIFRIAQLAATVATPIVTETIKSLGANKQVNTVVEYEREGNIFKTGAAPFMKKL